MKDNRSAGRAGLRVLGSMSAGSWYPATAEALDALAGGAMPFRVDEGQDVCARLGRLADGAALLALFNANFDPLEGVHLRSTAPIASAQQLGSDGAWHDVALAAEGDGRYRLDVRLEIAVPGIFRLA